MRDISTGTSDEFISNSVQAAVMAEFFFDSQTIGMWTGYGTITYGEKEFLGGGNFVGVSPVTESQDLKANGVVLSLSGIPSNLVAVALAEKVKRRKVNLYIGIVGQKYVVKTEGNDDVLTEDGGNVLVENQFLDEPYRFFSGLMDYFEITNSGESAEIRLFVENALIIGQRPKISRYTDEDQKRKFPDDRGFEFINRLQDREIVW